MKTLRLILAALLTLTLSSCSNAAEKKGINPTGTRKGAHEMKTYYMGRFAIDVPAEFKLAVQSHRFRLVEIEEYSDIQDADQKWQNHLAKVEKMQKPKGVNKIVIKVQQFEGMGKWAKGVLYYSDYMTDKECNWDILVSYGSNAALFTLKGRLDKQQSMLDWLQVISRAYRPALGQRSVRSGQFHTKQGLIELPYKRQENTYARFEGPKEMVLRLDIRETHKVEEAGVMDRLAASLAVNFAPGVDVDKIRAGKRTVAGLAGQEIVVRLSDKNSKELFFGWDYQGKEDSGECPEIKIGVEECPDGDLGEKLELWDKVLNSFRAAFQ